MDDRDLTVADDVRPGRLDERGTIDGDRRGVSPRLTIRTPVEGYVAREREQEQRDGDRHRDRSEGEAEDVQPAAAPEQPPCEVRKGTSPPRVLVGLRERVDLLGGRFDAGALPSGWNVDAVVPLPGATR